MEKKKLSINKLSSFPVLSEQEQIEMKGGYTEEQMISMVNNGTWSGGYVDGWGYVSSVATVTGVSGSPGQITNDEWALILTAATSGGQVGATVAGGWGAAIGGLLIGALATYSAYTH